MSSANPFYRLAPFIQEFIYSRNWTELRAVQVEACRVIFDSDAHLLLATGTASGKTEAAFLPVLTLLHEEPPASVGVLYIGPTKALINDQFLRLNDLLREADIPCWHWHGDVSQGEKARLLKTPRGVLQITPESLESLLINKATELPRLFGDLRFVIIDEVHVFMGSDRGRQILCQLARLGKYVRGEAAADWPVGHTRRLHPGRGLAGRRQRAPGRHATPAGWPASRAPGRGALLPA